MIQSTYSSITNGELVSCGKKGTIVSSDPIPLLRDKYLSEYRTELEKAKVRKNLGIADENSLSWGNIEGFIEEQKDLVTYVESKWNYTTELNNDVTNIKEAMDYALFFVTNFKGEHDSIVEIQKDILNINLELSNLKNSLNLNTTDIQTIKETIIPQINKNIEELNRNLLNIDVDKNILNWIQNKLQNSTTLVLDESLAVKISEKDHNAIVIDSGLYVKDVSIDVELNMQDIASIKEDITEISTYSTNLDDSTTVPTQVGGIKVGTTVESLKGKTINQIIDTILFPTTVRDLIYPSVRYNSVSNLVEVGSSIIRPTLVFNRGDAGEELSRTDVLTFNGNIVESNIYDNLGVYTYNGSISYDSGNYLIDNKGNTTEYRIEAGTKTDSFTVTTTYPWYVGNIKQNLIKFDTNSGLQSFSVSGKAVIKLPGHNSTLTSFKVDGGFGYLDVDLTGWEESNTYINGVPYKVWTKKDEYPSILSHQITFKLKL